MWHQPVVAVNNQSRPLTTPIPNAASGIYTCLCRLRSSCLGSSAMDDSELLHCRGARPGGFRQQNVSNCATQVGNVITRLRNRWKLKAHGHRPHLTVPPFELFLQLSGCIPSSFLNWIDPARVSHSVTYDTIPCFAIYTEHPLPGKKTDSARFIRMRRTCFAVAVDLPSPAANILVQQANNQTRHL
jgi:hypothetical protein